jgi:type III restriction enzyme
VIGRDIPAQAPRAVSVLTVVESLLLPTPGASPSASPIFADAAAQKAAAVTLEVIREFQRLPRSKDLQKPDVHAELVARVSERLQPLQGSLPVYEAPDINRVVVETVSLYTERAIDIPRIVVTPTGDVTSGYRDFDLDVRSIRLQPVARDILVHHLESNKRERLEAGGSVTSEERLEDYLVRRLIDFDDVSYDDHADLLYKLAGQTVAHLEGYLKDEDEVLNVLLFHQKTLADLIHAQMEQHYEERATAYEATVARGFTFLRKASFTLPAGEAIRDFRAPLEAGRDIRGLLFGEFAKCVYVAQRFQSSPELRFAAILEDDRDVVKWVKPAPGHFQIDYKGGRLYEPDFVVETTTGKFLCEPKAVGDIDDADVRDKARAAALWCQRATAHELQNEGKPWKYLLIPHDAVTASRTFAGLARAYEFPAA